MKIFTVKEMVAAEKAADAAGHSYADMMETAGRGVAEAIIARQSVEDLAVLALVGPGNNGGDALVTARYLHWAGAKVVCYLWRKLDPQNSPNLQRALNEGITVLHAEDDQRYRVLRLRLTGVDLVLDGLLGTGVSRPIKDDLAQLLRQVKAGLGERSRLAAEAQDKARIEAGFEVPLTPIKPSEDTSQSWQPQVVAVDCPSGLNCDSGQIDPLALPADLTVTFAGPKRGHFLFPGAAACGELIVADIDIAPKHTAAVPFALLTADDLRSRLPTRPSDGHKGSFGRVLIAAGCDQYQGAPFLAARAAFRSGSGLVTLAVPEPLRAAGVVSLPEATYLPQLEQESHLTAETARVIVDELAAYKALLIGPGLSTAAAPFLNELLPHVNEHPVVLDADALNILAAQEGWPDHLPPHAILTPHPGEMARLCGLSLQDLLTHNRFDLALEKAAAWGCVLVLKGAYTIVASPSGRGWVIPFANPLLAAAGSGDVLGGVIVSLLGQGATVEQAAAAGAFLHGLAAEKAIPHFGRSGLLAHELADWLPAARSQLSLM